jgi:hypothetical protein
MSMVFGASSGTLSKTPIQMTEAYNKTAAVNSVYFSPGEHAISLRTATVGEGWVLQMDLFVQGYITALGVSLQGGTASVKLVADMANIYQVDSFATSTVWETGLVIVHPGEPLPFKTFQVWTKKETGSNDVIELCYRQRFV